MIQEQNFVYFLTHATGHVTTSGKSRHSDWLELFIRHRLSIFLRVVNLYSLENSATWSAFLFTSRASSSILSNILCKWNARKPNDQVKLGDRVLILDMFYLLHTLWVIWRTNCIGIIVWVTETTPLNQINSNSVHKFI